MSGAGFTMSPNVPTKSLFCVHSIPTSLGELAANSCSTNLGSDRSMSSSRNSKKAPPLQRPAAPFFWTLAAQQVGKAAINGW
jgi:hypothetical protein